MCGTAQGFGQQLAALDDVGRQKAVVQKQKHSRRRRRTRYPRASAIELMLTASRSSTHAVFRSTGDEQASSSHEDETTNE